MAFPGISTVQYSSRPRSMSRQTEGEFEILRNNHLNGRAKSVFLAIPEEVVEQGFEIVISEMERALANDSTAARMRAITELKSLRLRPNQSVSEICVMLENLARKANSDSTISDRSL